MQQDWNKLAEDATLARVIAEMQERGFTAETVEDKSAALVKLGELLPLGANVLTGSSTTLKEIEFFDQLSAGKNGWVNMNAKIYETQDPKEQSKRRRQYAAADYFVASVNAVTESGQLVACDTTGSRVSSLAFPAEKVILIIGTNKIVPDLEAAFTRIREYVFPLEDARATEAYGTGAQFGKWLILDHEVKPGRVHIVFVKEELGF